MELSLRKVIFKASSFYGQDVGRGCLFNGFDKHPLFGGGVVFADGAIRRHVAAALLGGFGGHE